MAVVIPAAPGSPHLRGALEACRSEGATRVFVVLDEGSETPAGIAAPGTPFVARVPVAAGAGFAARANAGLDAAAAAGFARALLLNDDTRLAPGALAALGAALDGGAAIAGAVLLDWERGGIQQAGLRVGERSARVRAVRDDPGPDAASVPADAVSGAAMALDLVAFARLGRFHEGFSFYFEDIDLCLRARAAGLAVVVAPQARVRHRGGGTRPWTSPEAARQLGRSHALLARRLGGGPLRTAARLLSVGGLGTAWALRSGGPGSLPAFARGYWEGVRGG
jgi:GT2 family glycosyltransferase